MTPSGSKPGARRASEANDCAASAAPATSPRDSASWPATSAPRARPTRRLPATRRLDSRTTSPASTREARQAGAVPNSTAAPSDNVSATPSTRQSMARRSMPGTSPGNETADHAYRPGRDKHAGATTQEPQHDTLAKQLQCEPPARRPHRGPNGQLTFAVHATRQEEIGDIGARNQQQASDGGHQQTQRRPRLAINLVGERHDLRAQSTACGLFARQSCRVPPRDWRAPPRA